MFMTRGRCTCVVKVEYKKKSMEDGFIPPNSFDKTFEELGITNGAQLVIIEIKNFPSGDADGDNMSEGGEDEMEEAEDELDEVECQEGLEVGNIAKEGDDGNPSSQKVD